MRKVKEQSNRNNFSSSNGCYMHAGGKCKKMFMQQKKRIQHISLYGAMNLMEHRLIQIIGTTI